jgi:hypothetical protein
MDRGGGIIGALASMDVHDTDSSELLDTCECLHSYQVETLGVLFPTAVSDAMSMMALCLVDKRWRSLANGVNKP